MLVAAGCSNEMRMMEDANTMLQTELQKSKTENKKLQSENKRLEAELKEEKRKLGVAEKIKNMREKGAKTETVLIGGKEDSLKLSVVGTYEVKIEEDTITFVLLENGKHEAYVNGESWKKAEVKVTWKMVGKEVHIGEKYSQDVYKIEPNGDLTHIADIVDGMRTDQKKPIYYQKY